MEAPVEAIDNLAQIIRQVDGSHSLGAAALAEAILNHPDFSTINPSSETPDPPEAPIWYTNSEASVWKSGWTHGWLSREGY